MDIALDVKQFVLIGFQCLCFGPYTAKYSDHYSEFINDEWEHCPAKCDLKQILADAIAGYVKN